MKMQVEVSQEPPLHVLHWRDLEVGQWFQIAGESVQAYFLKLLPDRTFWVNLTIGEYGISDTIQYQHNFIVMPRGFGVRLTNL